MKQYSYIGVAEDSLDGVKFIVRSKTHPIHSGDIVYFWCGSSGVFAEVLTAAFLRIGGDEETMLAEFGEIHDVDKIYTPTWSNAKEEKKDA